MLEIFDKNGNPTLSINDNTTRVIAIYKKDIHKGQLPPPSLPTEQLQSLNMKPFLVSNIFYDLTGDLSVSLYDFFEIKWGDNQRIVGKDVCVLGVYNA